MSTCDRLDVTASHLAGSEVKTIYDLIHRMASTRSESIFLISPETGRVLTFGDFRRQASNVASKLRQLGLSRGDKVAFLMDNGLLTAQLFLGAMYGGFVSVPLNVRAGVSQLSYMLNHCDAEVVFVEDQYAGLMNEVMVGVGRAVRVISADIDSISTMDTMSPETAMATIPAPEDVALLMYTSGSTGQPKAAVHLHRTLLAHGRNVVASHQLSSEDRSLLVLPLYHINAECVTLIPTLLSGGSVVVAHRFSLSHFWDWLDEHRCTWSALVPTIIAELLDWEDSHFGTRQAAFKRIRFLRTSSAPISPSLQRRFIDKFHLLLLQGMGSSEGGNVFSNPLPPRENKIGSTGLPWGFETKIIDRDGAEASPGEPGEVLIRGAGLAQGYYKEPEATAAVFDREGWLHTGDLAYRDSDGYFFVVGRSKELIIKGGVNIAPRQIDEVLESHPAVREAAVVGVPDHHLGEDLVAFVVPRTGVEVGERELLAFCETHLGTFKTPTRIHFTGELPKGPSGKVQRLRLLDEATQPRPPRDESASARKAFGTAGGNGQADRAAASKLLLIEQTIAGTWAELLRRPQVDAGDNFFALGGDSLLAIQVLSQLRDKLAVRFTLSEFFENGTVAKQAEFVRNRLDSRAQVDDPSTADQSVAWKSAQQQPITAPVPSATIRPRYQTLPYRLSPGQERLWFLEQLNPGVPTYNESEAVRLRGELNVEAMEQGLNAVVARHEMLRTTIEAPDGQPMAVVHEDWPLRFKKIDLSGWDSEQRDTEVERLLIAEPRIPYSLQNEPGIRVTLIRLAPREHVCILMMHHIICDYSSLGILWRELAAFYCGTICGQPVALPPLPIQDGDYAVWQRQQLTEASLAEDLAFWVENLRGAPALLDLPSDRPRPALMSHRGARKRFRIDRPLTEALRNCNRRAKTSLFTLFASVLKVLLYRYTGSEDISVGIPIADRDRTELQSAFGFLLHTQVLRTELSGDITFLELLARVQQEALKIFEHRFVPFDQVVRAVRPERNLSYSPLFQVMFNWRDRDQLPSSIGLAGLELESLLSETRTSKFDLTLLLTDIGDEIWVEVEYNIDLFDEASIVRMFGHYRTLLEAIVADPDQRLNEPTLMTPGEREQVLYDFNSTAMEYPREAPLAELIEAQAASTPNATAVVFEDSSLTYRDLNERANQLAHELRKHGAGQDRLVGMCLERSIDMSVALLAIVKAGAAYLPLDPDLPAGRLAYMIADSGVRILLTERKLRSSLPSFAGTIIDVDNSEWQSNSRENSSVSVTPKNLAYVIYTSGSTGRPKGVQISRGALINILWCMRDWLPLKRDDTLLAVTTISFDIAGIDVWLPLLVGARCVIASHAKVADGQQLQEVIERHNVNFLQATPVTWQLLLAAGWQGKPDLTAVCTGEAMPKELAAQLQPVVRRLWNLYGPTETTIWSTGFLIEKGDQPVLIGRPVANTQCYVLDEQRQPVPVNVVGELYISGGGLARGYLNRPELTDEKFVPNPFVPDKRMYRTGDLARYCPDGNIECLGRTDHQVKIRGFRIELGEIETVLNSHPGVGQSLVVAREGLQGDKTLVAYFVPKTQQVTESGELRNLLKKTLPDYMVPTDYVALKEIPVSPNGKVDREGLPVPERRAEGEGYVAPRDEFERHLCEVWAAVLGLERVGIRDDFFELGGHSLLALQLWSRLQQLLPLERLSLSTLLEAPTVERFAVELRNAKAHQHQFLVRMRRGSSKRHPFFCAHGAGGNALNMRPLAMALPADLPFYCFQDKGLDGSEPFESVEETAHCYVDEIRQVQPHGPYYLGGTCYGGRLAFEMARELEEIGEPVGALVLIDSSNPAFVRSLSVRERFFRNVWFYLRRGAWHARRMFAQHPSEWLDYIVGRRMALGRRMREPAEVAAELEAEMIAAAAGTPLGENLKRVIQANVIASSKFVPKPYGGGALIFRASARNLEPYDDYFLGWESVVQGRIECFEIEGDHMSILEEPAVRLIAEKLGAKLTERSASLGVEKEKYEAASSGR